MSITFETVKMFKQTEDKDNLILSSSFNSTFSNNLIFDENLLNI